MFLFTQEELFLPIRIIPSCQLFSFSFERCQKMNDYIKEVAVLAGINHSISITKFVGTKRIDTTYQKHELISTHAARRTFAIVSLEMGMRIEVLQKILGHKTIKTTMRYVFIQEDVKNSEVQKAWK